MNSSPLQSLSRGQLEKLHASLRSGSLSYGLSEASLRKSLPGIKDDVVEQLLHLENEDWTPAQLAFLVQEVLEAKASPSRLNELIDVVVSGPDHPAIHVRDTAAVFREMIEDTQKELILASYAIYNGKELFAPIIARQKEQPDFDVHFLLDIPRTRGDKTNSDQIVARYRHAFAEKQWPGDTPPNLYYFTASLESDWKKRASMHAKIVIADRKRVFITSANLTNAAHQKNIETGIVIKDTKTATQIANYLFGLIEQGEFRAF